MNLLAPIYNQLMALVSRLTNGRAAALDNLDAPISTRAVASTALSNSIWSNDRATKLENLDAAITSRLGAGSVRRGEITILANATSATATLSPAVNPAKCQLSHFGSRADTTYVNVYGCTLVLTNSTTITATRGTSSATPVVVSWELIEYS